MTTTQELLGLLKTAIVAEKQEGDKLRSLVDQLQTLVGQLREQNQALSDKLVEFDSEELAEDAQSLESVNAELENLLAQISDINPTPVNDAIVDHVKGSEGVTNSINEYETGTNATPSVDVINSSIQVLGENLEGQNGSTPGSQPNEKILIADSTIPTVPGSGLPTPENLTELTFERGSTTVGFSDPALPSEPGEATVTIQDDPASQG